MNQLPQLLVSGILTGVVYGLVAVGYSLVYSVLGLVNFAHGAIVAIGAYTTVIFMGNWGWSLAPTTVVVVLFGVVVGLTIERFAYRPVRAGGQVQSLITALGAYVVIENIIALVFGSDAQNLPANMAASVVELPLGVRVTTVQIATLIAGLAIMGGVQMMIDRAAVGRRLRAVADDPARAATAGVDVEGVLRVAFGVGSGLGALAGMFVALDTGCNPYMGGIIGFKAFAACAVARSVSVRSAMLVALGIGVGESMIVGYLSSEYRNAIVLGVLTVLMLGGGGAATWEGRAREA